jgi:hypothetical protein
MTADRQSLNRAFLELGLRFQWDENTWTVLAGMSDLRSQLGYYLPRYQPHLLRVYDADFLRRMIEERLAAPTGPRVAIEAHSSF